MGRRNNLEVPNWNLKFCDSKQAYELENLKSQFVTSSCAGKTFKVAICDLKEIKWLV
jgi:hypothetical protein